MVSVSGAESLPAVGVVRLVDPETGRVTVIDTADTQVRAALTAQARLARERLADLFARVAVRPLYLDPYREVAPQILRHLGRRAGRAA